MQPIDLKCCNCGADMGALELDRLPRAMQLSLTMLSDQFGGRSKRRAPGADEGALKIPTVCVGCRSPRP